MSPTKTQLIPVSWRPFPALLGPEHAGIHADQMFSGVPADVITRVLLPRALYREKKQRTRWSSGGWRQGRPNRGIVFLPAQVIQNPIYGLLIFNASDDFDSPTATVANLYVDVENALQSLRPGHCRVTLCRCPWFCIGSLL